MPSRPQIRFAAGVLGVVAIAASCGSPQVSSTPATSALATSGPVQPAGDAVLVNLSDGGQLDWNTLQGQDVMLWFWAPW